MFFGILFRFSNLAGKDLLSFNLTVCYGLLSFLFDNLIGKGIGVFLSVSNDLTLNLGSFLICLSF